MPLSLKQNASTDSSKPLASAKKAEVEELASKVASYELGRQFCAALLKSAGAQPVQDENELVKAAGRRDFDLLIAQAAEELENHEKQASYDSADLEKQAEEAGAAYFDEVLKQAALEEAVAENQQLTAKLAEYEAYIKQAEDSYYAQVNAAQMQEQQVKLAESVADIVLGKLKAEMVQSA